MSKKLSDSQIEVIKNLGTSGSRQYEIADAVGCSVATVVKYMKLYNIPASNRWGGGGVISNSMREVPEKVELPNYQWITKKREVVRFVGLETRHVYTIDSDSKDIRIAISELGADLLIKKDKLVSFRNELNELIKEMNL